MEQQQDPTKIDIWNDPAQSIMSGTTIHGNMYFSCPIISHIGHNLWVGGYGEGMDLPANIDHVISLYPWEQYKRRIGQYKSYSEFVMYDSNENQLDTFLQVANLAVECLLLGPTLIHCQAGLNRSNTVAAIALIMMGAEPEEAVDLLRERRSPAVLCNRTFENMVLSMDDLVGVNYHPENSFALYNEQDDRPDLVGF